MPKEEFMSALTLQSSEGKEEDCLKLIKEIFDDPLVLSMEFFHSEEDPEILLAQQRWSSIGVFQEYMKKIQSHELFLKLENSSDYLRVTHWKPML
ncbi:MAG: hypothetical protein S4CHLAM6_07660 [Chlamydiae bacterium]|nr:hypothetical protein [Chlamydiota bacterium]